MFRASYNRCLLGARIETRSPLLIHAGAAPLDPTAADLTPVRTRHGQAGNTVYIPGSSLKGVLRSTAEQLLRSRSETLACDPLNERSCGKRLAREGPSSTAALHAAHCLACRLFGSTIMRGRASIRDLFPWRSQRGELSHEERRNLAAANATEVRTNVSIDPKTGSVAQGPFQLEVVPAGVSFWGELALENYQIWQLGLLLAVIEELKAGAAQLGSSKSRGLGSISVEIERIEHEQVGGRSTTPAGVAHLARAGEIESYGLRPEAELPQSETLRRGFADRFRASGAAVGAWSDAALDAWDSLS